MSSWDEKDGVLTVKLQPTIYLNNALKGKEKNNALKHEKRHFNDFNGRAVKLQEALAQVIRAHQDPRMEARWAWFLHDLCKDSAAFHRQVRTMV
jgi:hypothetical protein